MPEESSLFPFRESYKGDNKDNNFPPVNWNIPPRDKDKNWHIQACENIYSMHVQNQSYISISRQNDFQMFRLYAQGNQPTLKYMDRLCPYSKDNPTERTGMMNISWDIVAIAPTFRNAVMGIFDKIEHNIQCTAINEQSTNERDEKKWRIWADKHLADFVEDIDSMMGKKPKKDETSFVPSSIEELNMYIAMGGIKLAEEIIIEQLVDYTFYLSKWKEIKKQMFEDAFDLGVFVSKTFTNPITRKVECRYVDPQSFIAPYSRSNSFENLSKAAEVTFWTISQLREVVGEDGNPQFTEEQLQGMSTRYNGMYENPFMNNLNSNNNYFQNGCYLYDPFKVAVLDAEWFNDDVDVYADVTNKYGVTKTVEKDFDYTQEKANDEAYGQTKIKVSREKVRKVYKGKWIIGTKHIFEWGIANDQPFPPRLSFIPYKVTDKSIVANMMPTLDDIQIQVLKFRNAVAESKPRGHEIDVDAISNISFGGKGIGTLEILDIFRRRGDVLVSRKTHHSLNQNTSKAITELENGLGSTLPEFITLINQYRSQLADITGINDIVKASEPKPGALVGNSQLAVNATNNVLQPIYSGYEFVKEETSKSIMGRLQVLVQYEDIKGYYPAIGENGMQMIRATKDLNNYEFGIKLELRPTDEDKQVIRQAALTSLAAGRQGGVGITTSDYFFIERCLANGNMKYAETFLAFQEQKREKQVQALQEQNMQLNGQNAQQIEAVKAEFAKEMLQMKNELEQMKQIAIDNNRFNKEAQLLGVQHQFNKEEMRVDASHTAQNTVIDHHFAPNPKTPSLGT